MLNLVDNYASPTGLSINPNKTLTMILPTADATPQPIAPQVAKSLLQRKGSTHIRT